MKITKRQLRRIIKEEKTKLLRESETAQGLDAIEVLRMTEHMTALAKEVNGDLNRANRERGSSTTALVIRALETNKILLDEIQRLHTIMLGL